MRIALGIEAVLTWINFAPARLQVCRRKFAACAILRSENSGSLNVTVVTKVGLTGATILQIAFRLPRARPWFVPNLANREMMNPAEPSGGRFFAKIKSRRTGDGSLRVPPRTIARQLDLDQSRDNQKSASCANELLHWPSLQDWRRVGHRRLGQPVFIAGGGGATCSCIGACLIAAHRRAA